MDNENLQPNNQEESTDNVDNTSTQATDVEIQNQALQQLLKENRATMQALQEELKQVKTANAKLVAQLDVSKSTQQNVDDIINTNFNRYIKK